MLLWESPDRMPKPRSWKPCSPHNARPGASPVLGEARVASGRTGCVERGAGASPPVSARDSALARGEGSMVHARVVAHSPTHSPGPTAPHGVNSHTHGITAAKKSPATAAVVATPRRLQSGTGSNQRRKQCTAFHQHAATAVAVGLSAGWTRACVSLLSFGKAPCGSTCRCSRLPSECRTVARNPVNRDTP